MRASERLTSGILEAAGEQDAMVLNATDFNRAAEKHYREQMRQAQLAEAMSHLREDLEHTRAHGDPELNAMMRCGVRVQDPVRFLDASGDRLAKEELSISEISSMLSLLLIFSAADHERSRTALAETR